MIKSRVMGTAVGRPRTEWTPHLKQELIERLTSGETVHSIFSDPAFPARSTFYLEMARDANFRSEIACARKIGAAKEFDDFLALADQATAENYNAIKVKLWARTWALGRLDPSNFGDNRNVNVNVNVSRIICQDDTPQLPAPAQPLFDTPSGDPSIIDAEVIDNETV